MNDSKKHILYLAGILYLIMISPWIINQLKLPKQNSIKKEPAIVEELPQNIENIFIHNKEELTNSEFTFKPIKGHKIGEIFDIYPVSNTEAFIINLKPSLEKRYYLDGTWELVLLKTNDTETTSTFIKQITSKLQFHKVPVFREISKDKKYISLGLYVCWQCSVKAKFETMLINLDTLEEKYFTSVIEFEWLENGNFSYKDFIIDEKACTKEEQHVCDKFAIPIRPEKLPLKHSSFDIVE